jgi:peptide/nickel transport system substrate-binding protein
LDPKWVRVIAIVVVVGVIAAGVGVYFIVNNKSSCSGISSKNPLIFDQPEKPDSLDPGQVYTTPGWGIVQQVYQTLVMYNQTSDTQFNGLLAKNWSTSIDANGFQHWNFTMWPNEHFSNGDPLNAYVMWWSLYRNLIINQPIVFLLEENFYMPNVTYTSNITQIQASNASLLTELQSFTSVADVTNPPAALLGAMEETNQSFVVLNSTTIEFNIGAGYNAAPTYPSLLDQIASPPYSAVDPLAINANGGVQAGTLSTWMNSHMLGSGPFNLSSYNPTTGFTLVPNGNYWGSSLATAEPWNNGIQPAQATIEVVFQEDPNVDVENLKTGSAATASFAYVGPTTLSPIKGDSCITIQALPTVFGSVSASWWVYMDQNTAPFSNWSMRAAVVHAIDYNSLIQSAYGGNAAPWAGPIPPGFPDAPTNVTPYQFNMTLACAEALNTPWPYNCATHSGGYSAMTGKSLYFEYVNVGNDPFASAEYIQADLANIGITVNLVGVDLNQLAELQAFDSSNGVCTSAEASPIGGPFPIGEDYYTADYVAPDDPAQLNALGGPGVVNYNICMSEYYNPTVNSLVYSAYGETNPTAAAADYWQMTEIMYQNYTNAWLYVPTAFAVYNNQLHGIYSNPMGSGLPFVLEMNTEHAG